MKVNHLKLYMFKNHEGLSLDTKSSVIGIHGLNGVGKTNVLDAIYMLCVGKSYFSSTDLQVMNHAQSQCSIMGEFEKDERYELKLVLQKGKRKVLESNGKKYGKLIEHLGKFHAVVIAPSDIALIYGDNADRRRFIDQTLSQTDQAYLQHLVKYKKWIEQRNAHLKQDRVDHSLLDALDTQISPSASFIHTSRMVFLKAFVQRVKRYYQLLSDEREEVGIDYLSHLSSGSYEAMSASHRQKDLILRRSSIGVHKDEVVFEIDGEALKKFGSQGQVKSFLIALKLAQFEHFREHTKETPLLLLDDIFEKIDDQRANALTNIIKSGNFGQLFVTDTQQQRLEHFCASIDSEYQLIAL